MRAEDLSRLMVDRHLRSVPVVDGGRLVGIVSRVDLPRMIARDDEDIARDMSGHLAAAGQRRGRSRSSTAWSRSPARGSTTRTGTSLPSSPGRRPASSTSASLRRQADDLIRSLAAEARPRSDEGHA
jgi:CBS domain